MEPLTQLVRNKNNCSTVIWTPEKAQEPPREDEQAFPPVLTQPYDFIPSSLSALFAHRFFRKCWKRTTTITIMIITAQAEPMATARKKISENGTVRRKREGRAVR